MATADPNDLNQDQRVTKEEIDKVAGKQPSTFGYRSAPQGTGFWGQLKNWAFQPGPLQNKGAQDDWTVKRDTLYKKYGITQGAAVQQPNQQGRPGYPSVGGKLVGGGMKIGGGATPGGAADKDSAVNPAGLLGTYGGKRTPVNKHPFPTLGVTQGLIDSGIVREQMSPTGDIVYVTPRAGGESVVMQYKAQDAYIHLAEMDDEQLGQFRRAMYISGYGTPSMIWAGPLNTSDVNLMVQAMTDANIAGGTWNEVVNKRVEAGGRYARPLTMYEAAVNGGDTAGVLNQYAKRNGIVLSDSFIANQQRAVADGEIEMDDLLTLLKETYVKTLYPAFAKEVDQGLTIEDLAGPWRSYVAETFGVPETEISLFDPLVQAAMQNFGPDGKATKTAMNDFADMVQQDPRWQYSPDAWNKIGMAQEQLSSAFGASTQYQAPTTQLSQGPGRYGSVGGVSGG